VQVAELAQFARAIGQFIVGEMPPDTISERMIRLLPVLSNIFSNRSSVKDLLSKIQSDTRVWLGTAYEHVPRGGPLQRLRVVRDRSGNQTSHASVADSSPARPADGNIARFGQFKQARELRIPGGGDPAAGE
jgi:hypothetical protein